MNSDTTYITRSSLDKAISLIFEEKQPTSSERCKPTSRLKWVRKCKSSNLKTFNLQRITQSFNSESVRQEMVEELRNNLLQVENKCSAASKLIEWLLLFNSNIYLPVIWKSAVVLFLNHNPSNQDCLGEFLEMCAEQRLPEQKDSLLKMLLTLPKSLQGFTESSKHIKSDFIKTEAILSDVEDELL